MPEFGWTDFSNPTGVTIFTNKIIHCVFQCPTNGDATSITFNYYSYAYTVHIKCALYDNNGNFIAETEERTLSSTGGAYIAETFNFIGGYPILNGDQKYILAVWGDGAGRCASSDTPVGSDLVWKENNNETYPNFPSVLTYDYNDPLRVPNIYCSYTEIIDCATYYNQTDCENAGCYWWNNSCHDTQPTCEQINNIYECVELYGCYWYDDSCHTDPLPIVCEDITNQPECLTAGCYWYNDSCHTNPQPGEIEDFTTYEINDQFGNLTVEPQKITATNLMEDAEVYVRKDFGENYFGDVELNLDVKATNIEIEGSGTALALTKYEENNTSRKMGNNNDGIGIMVWRTPLARALGLWEFRAEENYDFMRMQLDVDYYLTFRRNGNYIYLDVYSGPERLPSQLIDTLTVHLTQYVEYRWLYAQASRGYPFGNQTPIDYEVSNLDLTIPICSEYENQTECLAHGCYWYNSSCHDYLDCEQINNDTDCIANGCYWYNNSCHSSIICENINNQSDCTANGCYWYNDSCHTNPPPCDYWDNPTDCEDAGCYWYNNSCHSSITCENIDNKTDCEHNNCYWYNENCHSSLICEDIVSQTDCEANGCYWYDNSCHSQLPCNQYEIKSDCIAAGCYWYNNSCHDVVNCELITTQADCEDNNCIWYNNACHSQLTCEDYQTEAECWMNNCYWYNNSCHSVPEEEIPWIPITIGATAVGIIALAVAIKKYMKK